MSGWTKLFSSIVTSSIWVEDHVMLRIWVAMLALADFHGVVEGSIPGFANLARVTVEEMRTALEKLSSPDPDSRTVEFEGRRIEAIDGGWKILNYGRYRERAQAKEGGRAPYLREYRARKAAEAQTDSGVSRNTEMFHETQKQEARSKRQEGTEQQQRPRPRKGVEVRPAEEVEALRRNIREISEATGRAPDRVTLWVTSGAEHSGDRKKRGMSECRGTLDLEGMSEKHFRRSLIDSNDMARRVIPPAEDQQ